jgi:hypothetical protein
LPKRWTALPPRAPRVVGMPRMDQRGLMGLQAANQLLRFKRPFGFEGSTLFRID